MILVMDTGGRRCGVALWDERLIAHHESEASLRHNEILLNQVQDLLQQTRINPASLSAIAVTSGPGSFTGLRVGLATAKGLCWTLGLPLICVPTLESIAAAVPAQLRRALPLIPARASEIYWAIYEFAGDAWRQDGEVAVSAVAELPGAVAGQVFLCGEGYERHKEELDGLFGERRLPSPESEMLELLVVSAARLAARRFAEGRFDDVAQAEPQYHYSFPAKRKLPVMRP